MIRISKYFPGDFFPIVISGIILCITLAVLFKGAYLKRPLEIDELRTLRYYTTAGIQSNGEQRSLERIRDIYNIKCDSLKNFAVGTYCSLGRWTEPNNHVLESFLMNLSFLFFPCNEQSVRLPSIIGFALYAITIYYLVYYIFQWRRFAPLALILAISFPFAVHYSQTARGYIWMLTLHVLLFIAMYHVWRKPLSIKWAIINSILSIISIINIMSTSIFIIVPIYCSFIISYPIFHHKNITFTYDFKIFYKNLLCQLFFISAVCFVFFMDRLPYIYSSLNLYGQPFQSISGFLSISMSILQSLFPSLFWKGVGVVGTIGLIIGTLNKKYEFVWIISISSIITLIVIASYAIISNRFGYDRTYGFLLNYSLIGIIIFFEYLSINLSLSFRKSILVAIYGIAILAMIYSHTQLSIKDMGMVELMKRIPAIQLPKADTTVVVSICDEVFRAPVSLYFPPDWKETDTKLQIGQYANLLLLLRKSREYGWGVPLQGAGSAENIWDLPKLDGHIVLEIENAYRVVNYSGQCFTMKYSLQKTDTILVFWYVTPESVAVCPDKLFQFLDQYSLRYLPQKERYQAKLEVFSRISCVIIVSENIEEFNAILNMVNSGNNTFGNNLVAFIPILEPL